MWGIVWLTSLTSPLLVWAWLPFLRGQRGGLCECSTARLLGVCGVEGRKEAVAIPLRPAAPGGAGEGASESVVEPEGRGGATSSPPSHSKSLGAKTAPRQVDRISIDGSD